jgi:hypothetical protein
MTRRLNDLSAGQREVVVARIQLEAQEAGWHDLNNREKAKLYDDWVSRFKLARQAIKDGIMKGFDAAQGIPPSGEAAIHLEVIELLEQSAVPYWGAKVKLWEGRAQADYVIGFNRRFLTHTVELEPASTWRTGLMQALWYKSAYFHEARVQAIPTLILFGNVSAKRWTEIETTCLDQRALVVPFKLHVEGQEPADDLQSLLSG